MSLPTADYLGRYQLGEAVRLGLATPSAAEPVSYRVYQAGVLVAAGALADVPDPDEPARASGPLVLDRRFAPGRCQVVYQYEHAGVGRACRASFEVAAGGDPIGPVVAGVFLPAAERDLMLVQLESGRLALARGPAADEGVDP